MKFFKLKYILLLTLILSKFNANSQQAKIDSLVQIISSTKIDTVSIKSRLYLAELIEDSEKQIEHINKALKFSEKINYKKGIAKAYSQMGVYYTNKGDFDVAVKFLNKSLSLFKELGIKEKEAAALGNMGNIYCYKGDYDKGLECFLSVLDVMNELNNKSAIATVKNNIGSLYIYLDNDSLALKYYKEAYAIFDNINDEGGMSLTLNNLANVYNADKKHKRAIEYFHKSITLSEKNGNIQQLGLSYTNIAMAYEKIGDNKNAMKYFEKAISVFKKIGNKNNLAITYLNLSYFYRDTKDYLKAKKYVNLSNEISKEIGAKHTIMKVYKELAFYDSEEGNYSSALENYKMFSDMRDSIFKIEQSEQIVEMQTKFDTQQKEKENELLKEKNAKNELQNARKNILIISGIILVIFLLTIGFIIQRISHLRKKGNIRLKEKNAEISQQKEEISAQNELLNIQNEKINKSHIKIKSSITYAKRIQDAMLPSIDVIDNILPENFIFFEPCDIVSGDFYWVKKTKGHIVIVVADCTGHGVPGAMLSMLAMSLLNDVVNNENITQANQVLEKLRLKIKKSLNQVGEIDEQKDGLDMALCTINLETNTMQYSGANIPLYHYRNGELIIYEPVPNPIGINYKEFPFKNKVIQLKKNDVFYMFSDGIVDQFHPTTKKKFKPSGLRTALSNIHKLPMKQQKNEISKLYIEWTGSKNNQIDDILFLGFRI